MLLLEKVENQEEYSRCTEEWKAKQHRVGAGMTVDHSLCKLSLFFHLSNLLCWIYENVKALLT